MCVPGAPHTVLTCMTFRNCWLTVNAHVGSHLNLANLLKDTLLCRTSLSKWASISRAGNHILPAGMLTCCVQTSYLSAGLLTSHEKKHTRAKRKTCKNASSYLLLECSEGENCTLILRGQRVENSRNSKKKKKKKNPSGFPGNKHLKCKNWQVCLQL